MLILKRILFTCLLLFPVLGWAKTEPLSLESLLMNINSLQADFVQLTNQKTTSGKMALQRPGKFRWEIVSPNQQKIIADGRYIWIYDVDLEQVTKRKIDYQQTGSPAMLLSGSMQALKKAFTISSIQSDDGMTAFKLIPRSKYAIMNWVKLYFAPDKTLSKMQIADNLGQLSTIQFSNIKVNEQLDPTLFQFTVPKNVDLLNG